TGCLTTELACVQCGYNLRTIHLNAACPECGTAVGETLNTTVAQWDPRRRVTHLYKGVTCLLLAIGLIGGGYLFGMANNFADDAAGVVYTSFLIGLVLV